MITIGYSTKSHKPEFIDYLIKSSGFKKTKVIEKINNGDKSLSQVYNEILDESETDIVVLCHDDIYFDTTAWFPKVFNVRDIPHPLFQYLDILSIPIGPIVRWETGTTSILINEIPRHGFQI